MKHITLNINFDATIFTAADIAEYVKSLDAAGVSVAATTTTATAARSSVKGPYERKWIEESGKRLKCTNGRDAETQAKHNLITVNGYSQEEIEAKIARMVENENVVNDENDAEILNDAEVLEDDNEPASPHNAF